ncbi:MAG: DUF1176 domain-containing protein [Cyanobacteria bacterium P01_E01_bin.42]
MKSLKLTFFALFIANFLSCHGTSSHAAIEQRDDLNKTDKQAQIYRKEEKSSKIETSADRKQIMQQIRHESYEKALENLKLAGEYNPNSEVIMQNLLEYKEQTFAIFDGCVNYWLDGDPADNISRDEWEEKGWRSHYQYFPERTQYTRIYPVETQKYLIALSCWTGSYWVATAYYLYDISETLPQVRSLILPTYDRATNRVIPSSSNINYGFDEYDPENRILSLQHKYAGTGLCGRQATYSLENNEWILTEFREQEECDGTTHISEDFPLLYP